MQKWGRRIRAAIGMGLIWGAAWFGGGILLARIPGFYSDVPFALLFAPLGFVTGIIFSGILVVIEGRRRLDRMSLSRFAGWGAVSGLLLSAIGGGGAALRGEASAGDVLVFGLVLAMASAACAAGSLAMARRAERRELADQRGDPAEAALTVRKPGARTRRLTRPSDSRPPLRGTSLIQKWMVGGTPNARNNLQPNHDQGQRA